MTAPIPTLELANLGVLANTFGLVPTTPAWSQVEAAMKRLEAAGASTGSAVSPEDARLVSQYRAVLDGSRRQLALGYACAAVLAAAAGRAGRTVPVGDALRTLSSALLLTQKPPAEVLSALSRTAEDLVALQLPGHDALEALLRATSQSSDTPVEAARSVWIGARAAMQVESIQWQSIDSMALRAMRERAVAWVRRRELQPARGAEIACRVADRPLASALRLHIDRSTAAEWSMVLLRGLDGIPVDGQAGLIAQPWMAAVAAVAVGLSFALGIRGDRAVIEWFHQRTRASGEAWNDLVNILEGTASPTGGRLLLLSSNLLQESLVAEWPPAAGGCTIVLRHDEMRRLLDTGLPRVLQSAHPLRLVLAVEVTGERVPAERALGELADRVGRDGAARVLISRERFHSEHATVVVAPRSAEELFDIVESQSRRDKA